MAYEVEIHDGATVYMLPVPSYPDGYQETIDQNAVARILSDSSIAVQVLSNQRVVTFDFKWTAVSASQLAIIMNAFDAVSRKTTCTMISPTGITYTVTRSPEQKTLRKRVYKSRGSLIFDISMTLRAVS